jgi:hypothetical protein
VSVEEWPFYVLRLANDCAEHFTEHGLDQGLDAAKKDIELVYC